MELKIKFRMEGNEKLAKKFSPAFIELINKAREVAMELGYSYITTIHFFIADCEIKNDSSLFPFFYTDMEKFLSFKNSYLKPDRVQQKNNDEFLFFEDESEYAIDIANQERITFKQSLIYPAHFFIAALTLRFTESQFYKSVKHTDDIARLVRDFYLKKGVFKITPMTWQERNLHFLGPGLNETIPGTGNSEDISTLKNTVESLSDYAGINTEALFSLKHHFDLLLINNLVARSSTQRPDMTIFSDEDFWSKAINGLLYPGQIVQLNDFKLFDWMAASPGITHSSLHKNFAAERQKRFNAKLDARPRDLRVIVTPDDEEEELFISAGSTAIRLAPKLIHNELQHMLTATSHKSPISGIPVTMNASYYSEIVGAMKSGEDPDVNLIGRLMILPAELSAIRVKYERTVPKFYLEVFEVQRLQMTRRSGTLVGPAISISVTYAKRNADTDAVTFHRISESFNNKPGEVQHAVERLHEAAAKQSGETNPVIIGDFDEFFDHFENVEFPIRDMANGKFSNTKLLLYKKIFGINISEFYMGDKNIITNSVVGAVGSNASAMNNTFNQMNAAPANDMDFAQLADQLAKLRNELTSQAKTPEDFRAVGLVASAEIAAQGNDEKKAGGFLKEAGKWVLDTATKIGVNLVSEIIKRQI